MWIKSDEYNRLIKSEKMHKELELEVKRLAALITEKTEDCNMGPWCYDCKHLGKDRSTTYCFDGFFGFSMVDQTSGEVMYCKKHLHEICPEFELKG